MRSIRTNHQGFAAVNLMLHNTLVTSRCNMRQYNRPWYISEIDSGINWRRIWFKNLFRALFLCWEPHNLRTEKQWRKALDRRMNVS